MMPGIKLQQRRVQMMLLASPDTGCAAMLHWRESTRPVDYDPNDESSAMGSVVESKTHPFRCLFHQVDHRMSGFQKFLEVETGDVIIDYLEDLALDGKQDLRIEVGGKFYVQKIASKGLLESWDAQSDSGGGMRVLLLTPAA